MDNMGRRSTTIPYLNRCLKDVPALACLRDKAIGRPVALQGQFAEVGFGGKLQMRALLRNRDTADRLCLCSCEATRNVAESASMSRELRGVKVNVD